MSVSEHEESLRRLLDVGRSLLGELDTEQVLDRILEEGCAITRAQYAAVGVLNEDRTGLERFLTRGIDPDTYRAIGDLPHGRGVLGVLIEDPRPVRIGEVGHHPESYGFPAEHPAMRTFLGVPILVRGRSWGNLYLTEKEGGGGFTDEDEEAAVVLAQWAGTAIENARLYESSEERRVEAERAVRSLEAARDIADAVGGIADLDRVLELIVKRGRALIDARAVLIMLREGEELVIAASAGHASGAKGHRLPLAGSTSGEVLERGRPQRIPDVSRLRIAAPNLGVGDAKTALLVPMLHHGTGIGVLAAFDRGDVGGEFSAGDEQLLRTFAASAANAVALNRSVETSRLRSAIAAADAERGRWARELHDQTLQSLGGLRVLLGSTLRRGEASGTEDAMRQAIEDVEFEIENLRTIISDLRPSLLDDLGLVPAIQSLAERRRESGLEVMTEFEVPDERSAEGALPPALETAIYRLVQEALTNVVKHAEASSARVCVAADKGAVVVEIEDDGRGFDVSADRGGFGLEGIGERVYLAGGTLSIESGEGGTLVRAHFPVGAPQGR